MAQWGLTALGVAMLLALAGCGSPAADADGTTEIETAEPTTQSPAQPTTPAAGTAPATATSTPTANVSAPYFAFRNDDDDAWAVTLYLVGGNTDEFVVTYPNGTERTVTQNDVPVDAVAIAPANPIVASETYTVGPTENLFVSLRGCREDVSVWFVYSQPGESSFVFGPGDVCEGYTLLVERQPIGGGTYMGGDYTHLLGDPDTTYREL